MCMSAILQQNGDKCTNKCSCLWDILIYVNKKCFAFEPWWTPCNLFCSVSYFTRNQFEWFSAFLIVNALIFTMSSSIVGSAHLHHYPMAPMHIHVAIDQFNRLSVLRNQTDNGTLKQAFKNPINRAWQKKKTLAILWKSWSWPQRTIHHQLIISRSFSADPQTYFKPTEKSTYLCVGLCSDVHTSQDDTGLCMLHMILILLRQ